MMANLTVEEILGCWREMQDQVQESPILRQLTEHPSMTVSLYCDSKHQIGLIVQSSSMLVRKFSYKNLQIQRFTRYKGKNRVAFVLLNSELVEQFALLCLTIVKGLEKDQEIDAGTYLAKHLSRWSLLLKKGRTLTEERERGLWCELQVLKSAIQHYGLESALKAWEGPMAAPQDFICRDAIIEVKALFEKSGEIKISSLDQLDCAANEYLMTVALEQHFSGQTLKEKVEEIESEMSSSPELLSLFRDKLFMYGYCEELDETGSSKKYLMSEIVWYDASAENFPSLKKSKLGQAILRASYILSVAAIEPFVTEALF